MLIVVASLKGSPGVTTFALALAASLRTAHPVILVEADPAGGDLAARYELSLSPGLISLAAAAPRDDDPGLLAAHTQSLPGGLHVVLAPPGAEHAHAALTRLIPPGASADGVVISPLAAAAHRDDVTVILDAGRLDPGSPVLPLLRVADRVLLLARSCADDLAHVAARLDTMTTWTSNLDLVIVGDGYADAEIASEVGLTVVGRIPLDRTGAGALSGEPGPVRRRGSRSGLLRAVARIATHLVDGAALSESPTTNAATAMGDSAPPASRSGTKSPEPPAADTEKRPEPLATVLS